jgi:sulfide:quinone oxidoreductase
VEIRKVSDQFSVSGQLVPDDVTALHAAGVRTLVCNRPDFEAPDQPAHAAIDKRALELGMQVQYLPVVHDTISAADVDAFAALMESATTPVHAWCRSGLRSITLWSLAQIKAGGDPDAQVSKASALGFDFRSFRDKFAQIIARSRA